MIPAVIYARYSSSNQREESIAGQIRDCTEFANRNNYHIVGEYTDSALTGRTDRRPGFQEMIRDSDKHGFQAVIVWKLDRFARNRYDSAMYRNILKKNGVKIVSAMESISESPEGIILEGLMESLAEYYSANLSENVKRGLYDSALDKKMLSHPSLGYRKGSDGKYEIDPITAPIVRRIFDEFAAGSTQTEIITRLNRDGFRTVQGNEFNKNSLRKILRNKKYIGVYQYRDIYDPNGVPAIIEKELFDDVQQILSQREKYRKIRSKEDSQDNYLLSSILFCGHCESPMTGESARSANGTIYKYYSCAGTKNRTRNGCKKKRVSKDLIEQEVIRIVNEEILTEDAIDEITKIALNVQKERLNNSPIAQLENELDLIDKKIKNLIAAIEDGSGSKFILESLSEREAERDRISARIQDEKARMKIHSADEIKAFLNQLKALKDASDETQRILIESCVKRIYLFDTDEPKYQKIVILMDFFGDDSRNFTASDIVRFSHDNPSLSVHKRTIANLILIAVPLRTKK